ncbi:MAG TPA: LysM peptidoglycan-binding domain-containing protein [Candidatus Binatia bacterium]|nr:LysM peptidoglycan-binding domain-containing protein [Candidatus Binatia bacterium]
MKNGFTFFAVALALATTSAKAQPGLLDRPVIAAAPDAEIVQIAPAPGDVDQEFPRLPRLDAPVAFWTRVFSEYSEYQSAIHSMDQPQKIYRLLDFRAEAQTLGPAEARRRQLKAERAAEREIDGLLKRVHLLRSVPDKMTPPERQVYELFADGTDPDRFKDAVGRFRAQRGLREKTENALQVAGRYLPQMESIFQDEGLPLRLTRLPLVESSFNLDAYSKVGAAGLWQFMPSSARLYMRLDEAVDERRDPWESTHAAARHLKEDYAALGNWPLAVTAYNFGRAGLARGLREVHGEGLEDLLQRWDGRRFGFASRNFYAEFLAASDVERNYRSHFGDLARHAPLQFETVDIQHYVSYESLRRCAGADLDTFHSLNPGFRPEVLDGRLYVPPQTTIRVPVGKAQEFRAAYAALGDAERFDQQRFYYVRYRVQHGDTLGVVARRYGVSTALLREANANPRVLRVGQVLRIPPRGHFTRVAAAEPKREPVKIVAAAAIATTSAATGAVNYLFHRVRPGQNLTTIARQYQTTIAALKELNGIDDRSPLYAGATLKVPQY